MLLAFEVYFPTIVQPQIPSSVGAVIRGQRRMLLRSLKPCLTAAKPGSAMLFKEHGGLHGRREAGTGAEGVQVDGGEATQKSSQSTASLMVAPGGFLAGVRSLGLRSWCTLVLAKEVRVA